ncbi:hypothetical protein RF11_12695 [Thelohanellus kitauei]|uniref:Uncharacterized protein n=1 Tax=Thelohanellus kitauei TaxID=669202 RepID=A0A0C2MYH4_THEKT|nr:hypothetical protein RF11_12695 [Thelohanellus kitauei]
MALSDETYINKLKSEKTLFMYEDLKSNLLSIIDESIIKIVLSGCETILRRSQYGSPECFGSDEYKLYRHVLTMILLSFNEFNYFYKKKADYYISLVNDNSGNSCDIQGYSDDSHSTSDSKSDSDSSFVSIQFYKLPFPALLRWFMFIYEVKFIFAGIDTKLTNLNFIYSLWI